MVEVQNKTGRLVEIRGSFPLTPGEVDQFERDLRDSLTARGERKTVCADITRLHVLRREYADRLLTVMREDNGSIDRTAILLAPDSPMVELQFSRILSEAESPNRRFFRERDALSVWLGATLNSLEQARLHDFLSEGDAAGMPTV